MIDHAAVFRSLRPVDFRLLKAIETGMKSAEWVDIKDISSIADLSMKEVEYRLRRMVEIGIVDFLTQSYVGYQLKFDGYDLLAINGMVDRGVIHSLGNVIGVGKESVIMAAMGAKPLAIKFHREGRTSFKQVKRTREHMIGLHHYSWLYAAKLAAEREFEIMKKLYPAVSIPEPIDNDRHAIAMSVLEGEDLSRAKIVDPEWYLDQILSQIKKTYELGFVHGDLSEYNVDVTDKGVTIIDWPQAVTIDSEVADERLSRDVNNILTYFNRKYRIKRDSVELINDIKGIS